MIRIEGQDLSEIVKNINIFSNLYKASCLGLCTLTVAEGVGNRIDWDLLHAVAWKTRQKPNGPWKLRKLLGYQQQLDAERGA